MSFYINKIYYLCIMEIEVMLNENGFTKVDQNEYVKNNWTVRIEYPNFEIFSDPEIDTRYYYGYLDKLERYLDAIK